MGFLVACCWVIYTFVTLPDFLGASLRNPLVEALAFTSCPISIAGRYFPLRFWWMPPANAVTYAAIGLIVEKVAMESMTVDSDNSNLQLHFKTDDKKFQSLMHSDLFAAVSH